MKRLPIFLTLWLLTFASPLLAAPSLGVKTSCAFMPYAPSASQIIYVTNPSAVAVTVTAKAFDDAGTEYDLGLIATVPSKTVSKLTTLLSNALVANGFSGTGKIAYEFDLSNSAAHAYFGYTSASSPAYVAPHRELYPLPAQSVSTPTPSLRITIPFMHYSSSSSSPIIYIANPSTVASSINVTGYDEAGNTYDLGNLNSIQIPARRVTKLTNALKDKLQQLGFSGTGKVTFIMELSTPEIMAHSSYYTSSGYRSVAPIRELYIP